jgi:RsiW-degrading membrane proteinase PrsW (M82 family)
MLQTLLAVSAVVPSLLLVWYFHARDLYPEPPRVIWTTFGLGVLTVIPVLIVGIPVHKFITGLAGVEHPISASVLESLLVAALPEEFFKLVVLVRYSMRKQEFDEPMDGIVYGVVASLGFATFENILYVMDGGISVAFSRAFSAVPLHAFLGAILGYYVGQAWKSPERRAGLLLQGYAIAVFLHAVYDIPLLTMNALGSEAPGLVLAAAALLVLIVAWRWALRLTAGLRVEQLHRETVDHLSGSSGAAPARVSGRRVKPIMQITFGVIAASVGGMVALGLLLAFLLGIVAAGETADVLTGGAIIGALPLVTGGLLFRQGVRGLNKRKPILSSEF